MRLVVSNAPTGPATPSLDNALVALAGGDATDPKPELDDYKGDLDLHNDQLPELFGQGRGLKAMESVDQVSLLLAPDQAHPNTSESDRESIGSFLVTSCEQLKDRFAVLSADRDFFKKVESGKARPPFDTTYAGFYYPWIKVYDPYSRDDVPLPPSGHVAGLMARTDIEQGVHKAPANAIVIGAKGLQLPITKEDQALLNPAGINCIRDFRADGRGLRLWGARTMTSDPEWKYIDRVRPAQPDRPADVQAALRAHARRVPAEAVVRAPGGRGGGPRVGQREGSGDRRDGRRRRAEEQAQAGVAEPREGAQGGDRQPPGEGTPRRPASWRRRRWPSSTTRR